LSHNKDQSLFTFLEFFQSFFGFEMIKYSIEKKRENFGFEMIKYSIEKKRKTKKVPLRGFSLRHYAVTRYAVTRFTNNPIS